MTDGFGLRQLRDFAKVAEHGSVTRAAQELFIAQPALSAQIRRLEEALGLALFVRGARGVTLTEHGEALLPLARGALAAFETFADEARHLRDAPAGTLRIGFLAQGAAELTPTLIRRFVDDHPHVEVSLRHFDMDDPLVGLGKGLTDVGFYSGPPEPDPGIAIAELFEDPAVAVMAADHPLARRDEVAIEELVRHPFLCDNSPPGPWHDYWLGIDHRDGRPPEIAAEFRSTDEWLEALRLGRGVSLCPASVERHYPRHGLAYRRVLGLGPSICGVAWRADDASPLVRAFVELSVAIAREARTPDARPPGT